VTIYSLFMELSRSYLHFLVNYKVQMCLSKVGAFLHTIQIEPIAEYYNLFEFVRILNLFIEYHMDYRDGYRGPSSVLNFPGWTSQRNQNVHRTESEVVFIPEKVVFLPLCQDPERDTHTFP
jgi:hypothetical protein